jgi:phosphoribosyl 1,2-cyclic phosphodiesterase
MSTKIEIQFLKDGTVVKYRSSYCSQQNLISEKRLRTTIEMTRIILIHLGMKTKYWEDVVIHSNYIRNQVITRVLKRMTQYEKFWGKKPDLRWT